MNLEKATPEQLKEYRKLLADELIAVDTAIAKASGRTLYSGLRITGDAGWAVTSTGGTLTYSNVYTYAPPPKTASTTNEYVTSQILTDVSPIKYLDFLYADKIENPIHNLPADEYCNHLSTYYSSIDKGRRCSHCFKLVT